MACQELLSILDGLVEELLLFQTSIVNTAGEDLEWPLHNMFQRSEVQPREYLERCYITEKLKYYSGL